VHLTIGADLHLGTIRAKANALQPADDFDAIALGEALQQLATAQASLTRTTLATGKRPAGLNSAKALLARLATDEGISISRLVVAASRLGAVKDEHG
jgi:NAD-specific glutamate dehydrogenase